MLPDVYGDFQGIMAKDAAQPSAPKTSRKAAAAGDGTCLIIVESPAKARTIEKFLGASYKVAASYGHIRDLPGSALEIPEAIKDKPWARLAVDTENDFTPTYVVPKDSKAHVNALRKLMNGASRLLLATDEDREGESISWHLLEELKPKIPVERIAFHEITRTAIEEALKNPRQVDTQLVRAQESRRILDRLYGYSLSPMLWKKVRTKLSAGRVQSVALRLIVEREEERMAFKTAVYWDVKATLKAKDAEFAAQLVARGEQRIASGKDFDGTTGRLKADSNAVQLDEALANAIAKGSRAAVPWRVKSVERKETRQRPGPPFTTSTLQQAASSNLGMSPRQTMMVAQRLYEGIDLGGGEREGLITYMRTDSVTLSQKALGEAGQYIKGNFGDDYYTGPRFYKTKSKNAQEAHEAIRPTNVARPPRAVAQYLSDEELRLYELIWKRTLASQMTDAVLDKTSVDIAVTIEGVEHIYRANGSIVRFPGYLKVQGGNREDALLPELAEGQTIGGPGDSIAIAALDPLKHETAPPARFTEASLVKKLEEEDIGRPSTYAPTLSTIQSREYVAKKGGALMPTWLGMAVIHVLRGHFPQYVDVKFTAKMEEDLDGIASGSTDWIDFLRRFYYGANHGVGLVKSIEDELPKIDFPAIPVGNDPETGEPLTIRIGRTYVFVQRGEGGDGNRATLPLDLFIDELTPEKANELIRTKSKGAEPITSDPETGKPVYLLVGPYGPYVQLGDNDDAEKPKRSSLPKGMKPEDVTPAEALKLLTLPRTVGIDPATGKKVTANLGRFGPYIERDKKYANVESAERLYTITLEEAVERLNAKLQKQLIKDLGTDPESGREVQILKGRFGPYITDGKSMANVPKGTVAAAMTLEAALPLLAEAAAKAKPAKKAAKKAPKKSAKKAAKKASKKAI